MAHVKSAIRTKQKNAPAFDRNLPCPILTFVWSDTINCLGQNN